MRIPARLMTDRSQYAPNQPNLYTTRMTQITFITGNKNKVAQVTAWLGLPVAHHQLDLDEIQSLDLRKITEHKARQAYQLLQRPVLVEDAALVLTAMGRLPGPYIKWFIEELGIEGLAKLAAGLESQEAVGTACYGYCDGGEVRFFEGEMRGRLVAVPRGTGGFGFDPIFMNDGFAVTRGEMTPEDYAATSYRTKGLAKLREFLQQ